MQSFGHSLYLYIVKTMRHLLLLAILVCVLGSVTSSTAADVSEPTVLPGNTYAVIISGGRSKMFNHERYWNDCVFLYRTLRQDCHLPKDHITLLMADGDDPTTDMLLDGAKGFASTPTDLDGDGEPDLSMAATRQNIDDTFRRLSSELTPSDHLFVFITDHGECDGDGSVHLWLWDKESVSPDELAALIGQCRPAMMNILLGQCYAGAFVTIANPLQQCCTIITAACAADQLSWACKDRPYDEFVYHWTCAVAQHDEEGQPVHSDTDGDGYVTMQEAYDYARQHDRRPETPSLTAHPATIARQWSFGREGIDNGIETPPAEPFSTTASHVYDLQGRKR